MKREGPRGFLQDGSRWHAGVRIARTLSLICAAVALPVAVAALRPQNAEPAAATNVENGKRVYESAGCAGCHGPQAKGINGQGVQIAPPPLAQAEFVSFVRHPSGAMRAFSKEEVSDAQLADVHAYLQSLSGNAGAAASNAASANLTGNLENGKRLFMRDGCYECHGILGQGANGYGPRLAPDPISLQAIITYIRKPTGNMPPYTDKIVPDQDAADIYAYLKSVPPPADLKNVPTFSK